MGAKIYVIKLKQILRVLLVSAIAAAVIIAAVMLIKRSGRPTYAPGVYTVSIILHNAPVSVEVEVSKHRIESVRLTDLSESQQVFYPLFASSADEVAQRIVDEQSCDIETDSDYAVTGGIICDAVRQALKAAEQK